MKLTHSILLVVPMLVLSAVFGKAQENRHLVSFATGLGLPIENSIYIDFDNPDFEIWSDPKTNISFTAAYEYRLNEYLRLGGQVEIEKINFDSYFTGEAHARRTAFGLTSFSQFPKSDLHVELAGFLNFTTATSDEFDKNMTGFEYGLMAGPAYDIGNFSVGLYFKPQFSYYFADSEAPEAGLLMYPRLVIRLGYSF